MNLQYAYNFTCVQRIFRIHGIIVAWWTSDIPPLPQLSFFDAQTGDWGLHRLAKLVGQRVIQNERVISRV